jgi:hypothetical protein
MLSVINLQLYGRWTVDQLRSSERLDRKISDRGAATPVET